MNFLVDEIRKFEVEGMGLEDLVALSAIGRSIQDEFKTLQAVEPEWLSPKLEDIRREVAVRQRDRLRAALTEKKARFEAIKPAEQKRQELAAEIAQLEEMLKSVP